MAAEPVLCQRIVLSGARRVDFFVGFVKCSVAAMIGRRGCLFSIGRGSSFRDDFSGTAYA